MASTSAISWRDSRNENHIRVYYSRNGNIEEKCWDGYWYEGAFIFPGETVSATAWNMGDRICIRAYVGNGSFINEYCWDGEEWYQGSFTAEGVSSSAVSWLDDGYPKIKVYVSDEDKVISEYSYENENGWELMLMS